MTARIERQKWILYRHTRDFTKLCTFAEILKSYSKTTITKEEKERLNLRLRELNLYNERNPELPLDALNHKINQLAFYMFGYKSGSRFLFSPLGNLLLKHVNDSEKVAKIFTTMLWALQFPHPHSGTNKKIFNIYPFRLIFKLLRDPRLEYRLYAFEVSYCIVFTEHIDKDSYETLVQSLIDLRSLSDNELESRFQTDSHVYVNSSYEWDYYVSEFLENATVLKKHQGRVICHLKHGTGSTTRKITRNFVTLSEEITHFADSLEREFPYDMLPLALDGTDRLSEDIIKEIYSFYPKILLDEIGEDLEMQRFLELPKLIDTYSNNPKNETAYLFENVLVEGFNMFYNVEAKLRGGAGHTDIECLYLSRKKKFAVESKSTANKLSGINVGRLREHREEIGGDYTIVVTSRYVPAAKRDIYDTPNVIILASTFAEFLYNCISHDVRDIDYEEFDKIIVSHLGDDVSRHISDLTITKFSTIGKE